MLPPYQCLQLAGGVVLAAASSRLDSFTLEDGLRLSSWICPILFEDNSSSNSQPTGNRDSEPPAKKRRLSDPHDAGETTVGNVTGHNSELRTAPAVIAIASTRDGDHVIVVTGEDKSIRVFEQYERGQLRCISQRVMPKRPCAIALTADETSIVCGDKFGDVYSIPLLFSGLPAGSEGQESTDRTNLVTKPSKPFVPAANDLTVHSIRNRRALQNQMRQKSSTIQKSGPQFDHKLLLGHVSMLTDIALVERDGRNYIITADRDEHIRISRGIPQAHIIEGYCLGHKEFVSRLCIPAGQPNVLISGGGDDDLYVWDWSLGELLHRINLRSHTEKVVLGIDQGPHTDDGVERHDTPSSEPVRIAVSNIQHMTGASDQQDDHIMVTCEGIPAIFIFSFQEDATLSHYQTLRLNGNPLGLVIDRELKGMIVSVDSTHKPGPTIQLRNDLDPTVQPLQFFQRINSDWVIRPFQFNIGREAPSPVSDGDKNGGRNLADLLYPIQKLRKTGPED